MRGQGLAEGESYKGQSSGNLNGKMAASSKHYCQRAKRCSALEPVLEHSELAATTLPSCETILHQHGASSAQKGKPLRFLSRLRDGYVKLMNDVASGAECAGVSSFYGAAYGAACAGISLRCRPTAGLSAKRRRRSSGLRARARDRAPVHDRSSTKDFDVGEDRGIP